MAMKSCVMSEMSLIGSRGDGRVFCAQQVFVQGVCVSCHCGPQSTVVQSRVCHCNRGDLQIHSSLLFSQFSGKPFVWTKRLSCPVVTKPWDVQQELWRFSRILTVPEEIIAPCSSFRACRTEKHLYRLICSLSAWQEWGPHCKHQ